MQSPATLFLLSLLVLCLRLALASGNPLLLAEKNSSCQLTHAGRSLNEGESVEIKGKIYKVEDCALHRAYHACGTHIFHIVNIVCQALESRPVRQRRLPRFLRPKLLTEACCQSVCTVSEMTRYCP